MRIELFVTIYGQKRQFDYNGIQDLFDTKFIAGLPEDIVSVVNENLMAI